MIVWLARAIKNTIIGTLLCLTPFTAFIVLGWMVHFMRKVALTRMEPSAHTGETDRLAWIFGPPRSGLFGRLFGALAGNIRAGIAAAVGLACVTLPFTVLWIGSWWAGWENSFNKGYEQSWVGPTFSLLGTVVGTIVLIHLPMALAHHAVDGRIFAFFELRKIRDLVTRAGIRYVLLSALVVVLALPLLGMRALPVFAEEIVQGIEDFGSERIEVLKGQIALVKASYIFVSLAVIRYLSARLYVFAERRSAAAGGAKRKKPWILFRIFQFVLLAAIWFGLIAQIYIGQFMNHSWWIWVNHPFLVLPWLP